MKEYIEFREKISFWIQEHKKYKLIASKVVIKDGYCIDSVYLNENVNMFDDINNKKFKNMNECLKAYLKKYLEARKENYLGEVKEFKDEKKSLIATVTWDSSNIDKVFGVDSKVDEIDIDSLKSIAKSKKKNSLLANEELIVECGENLHFAETLDKYMRKNKKTDHLSSATCTQTSDINSEHVFVCIIPKILDDYEQNIKTALINRKTLEVIKYFYRMINKDFRKENWRVDVSVIDKKDNKYTFKYIENFVSDKNYDKIVF